MNAGKLPIVAAIPNKNTNKIPGEYIKKEYKHILTVSVRTENIQILNAMPVDVYTLFIIKKRFVFQSVFTKKITRLI